MKGEKVAKKVHGEKTKHCLLKGHLPNSSQMIPGSACSKIDQDLVVMIRANHTFWNFSMFGAGNGKFNITIFYFV